MTPEQQAEVLYLTVYAEMAGNADYLEPEHGPDLLQPETIVAAMSATVLTSLLTGFFQDFGKVAAERLRRKPFRGAEVVEASDDELVRVARECLERASLDLAREALATAEVEQALMRLGVARGIAQRLARDLVDAVKRELCS